MILAIDPGLTGGLALMRDGGALVAAEAMPMLRNTVPTVDLRAFANFLRAAEGCQVHAWIERAQAMPRMAVSSVFNYGCGFGSLLSAVAGEGIGYDFVSPAKWKREMGLSSDKRASIDRVRQLYPTFPLKASEDGIAEAILIGYWVCRQRAAA